MDSNGDGDKRDVRRPMNAFLIFCKRHRSIVREKNPDLDNRSVTRILGDLWANLKEEEKVVYTDLAKQYKDAFMKANPDYKWHNPEKTLGCQKSLLPLGKPTNAKVMKNEMNLLPEGSIIPGKLADPCNMGGLSLLLMAGEQSGLVPVTSSRSQETSILQSNSFLNEVKSDHIIAELEREPTSVIGKDSAIVTGTEPAFFTERDSTIVSDSVSSKMTQHKLENVKVDSDFARYQGDAKGGIKLEDRDVRVGVEVKNPVGEKKIWADFVQTKSSNVDINPKVYEADTLPITSLESFTHKSLLYQAVAAPKLPQRSLLAEAFRDKGGYPDILRDNSASTKMANFENQGKLFEDQINDGTLEQKLVNKNDEKENLTNTFNKEIKSSDESKTPVEEESAMVTCGKLVVNHIIDKLYSSELGSAVRKGGTYSDEVDGGKKDEENNRTGTKVEGCENKNENIIEDSAGDIKIKSNAKAVVTASLMNEDVYVENEENKSMIKLEKGVAEFEEIGKAVQDDGNAKNQNKKSSKRQIQSGTDSADYESEEVDEFQPVRKSRRRNRGQRYQELINEGIIQRSKERTAALQQTTQKEESNEEDSQPMETFNSYILPETAIRRIRKRTTSESAKDKMLITDDAKRYKTGDFDLEAQIATLPACSVENMGRKRGFARQRHSSECFHTNRKMSDCETSPQSVPVFDVVKAVSMPPHMKIPSPENNPEPVVGSRKRKARKHSITHMIPAPPTLMKNGKVKADGDSLGPCLIKPPEEMLKEKTDSSVKHSHVFTVPTNGTGISVTSEKCSDWSKSDKLHEQSFDTKNISLSETEVVSDETNMCVSKLESSDCTVENMNKTGSELSVSNDCSLTLKVVTQSEGIVINQSVGAVITDCVQKDVQQDKQQCEINKDAGCEKNTEKQFRSENSIEMLPSATTNFVSNLSGHCLVEFDPGNLLKIEKDVNSNTTMNS